MTKNELMYSYAVDEYKNVITRKNDIRNRAFSFYNLSVPIITALATLIFTISKEYSCVKIVLLVISGLLFISTFVIFLMIYLPSVQMAYNPKDIVKDLKNIDTNKYYKEYVEYLASKQEEKEEFTNKLYDELAHGFLAERYTEMVDEYEKKNLYFKKLFIVLATLIIVSIVLLLISLII